MSPPRTARRANVNLIEKGIIATAIGAVLLLAPYVLRGSRVVNDVVASIRPVGWGVFGLGLLLLVLHVLLQRKTRDFQHTDPSAYEGRASRFQHTVLPEELLNPPSRIRLDPRYDPVPTEPASMGSSTMPSTLDTAIDSLPAPDHERSDSWGPEVLEQIEWRRFEAVCEALFAQAGFEPRVEPGGGQRATLLWLHSRHAQGPVAVASCRHWLNRPLGVVDLEPLKTAMATYQLKRATCVTSGGFTRKALEYAHKHGINMLDGPALLGLIGRRRPEQQQKLLDIAYEGEFWRPTCISCGGKMVDRTTAAHGPSFWGCMSYPRCRQTLPMATA